MIRRILASLLALLFLTSQVLASNWLINSYRFAVVSTDLTMTRGACQSSIANGSTYSFPTLSTGASDSDSVTVVVGVVGQDSASAFDIASLSIDTVAATEREDLAGVNFSVAGFYTANSPVTNAASVAISVTFSEGIQGAAVCAWAFKNLNSTVPQSVASDGTGTLSLGLSATSATGFVLGIAMNTPFGDTCTWAVLTEVEDTENSESDFSSADAPSTGSSMGVSVTWSPGSSSSKAGAAIALGN
jgi:hypothetical protein